MQKVLDFLEKEIKLNKDDIIVVGTSGGPDSMALLSLVLELRKKHAFQVVCAHVNHNVRVQSKEEESLVEKYAKDNEVFFEKMTIEKYGDDNFQNEARNIRYDFFEKIINKYQANYLMTGHHADDLIETIIMRIVRGSTIKGYSGFSQVVERENYKLIRPLYDSSKEEILKYCEDKKIVFARDHSNESDKYTRNRYRKIILPFLKEEDPNVHEKFVKFSKILEEYDEHLDKETVKILNTIYKERKLSIYKFNRLDHIIKLRVIHYILEEIYQDDLILINDMHAEAIIDLASSNRANSYIVLPNELRISKEYNYLIIGKPPVEITSYEMEIISTAYLPNGKRIRKVSEANSNDNSVCRLNSADLTPPFSVRTRKHGDKIALSGGGSQKLKDLFINAKIPLGQRDMWPVVVDAKDRVLWVPALKKSKYAKQKEETCDIILKYERGGANE